MRDLQVEGRQISADRDDRSLAADELRLVTSDVRVWEPGCRARQAAASEADRPNARQAAGYACRACGISTDERYPDDRLQTAKLSFESATRPGGAPHLRALCERRKAGQTRPGAPAEAKTLARAVTRLADGNLQEFARCAAAGERDRCPADAVWSRSLCAAERGGEITRGETAELLRRRETTSSAQLGGPGQVEGLQ